LDRISKYDIEIELAGKNFINKTTLNDEI